MSFTCPPSLGKISDFDVDCKEEVESIVSSYGSMSVSCQDDLLDIAVERSEIVKCIRKQKPKNNNKMGGRDGLVGELLIGNGFAYNY